MNERRRFNLGDILRKINEEGAPAHRAENPDSPKPAAPRAPHPSQPPPLQPEDKLPPQPRFDGSPEPTPAPPRTPLPLQGVQMVAEESAAPAAQYLAETPNTAHPKHSDDDDEEEEDGEFDIFRYLNVLFRRRIPIALAIIVALLYSLYNYLSAQHYYTAHARLLFRPGYQEITIGNQSSSFQWMDQEKMITTHLELLRSKHVLQRVSENLDNALTIEQLGAAINISQEVFNGYKTDIIGIDFRHPKAELARDAVNELSRSYIEYRREVNAQEETRFIIKLENQIAKLQQELDVKESSLRLFKEKHRMVQLSSETNLVMSKIADMELALQQSRMDMLEAQKRMEILKTQISAQEVNIVESITIDNRYQKQIADLEFELSTLSAEYSPEHYKVRMLRQQIDTLKKAMESDIVKKASEQTTLTKNPIRQTLLQDLAHAAIDLSILETKRTAQEQLLEQFNDEFTRLPSLEKEYADLVRETDSRLQTITMLRAKFEAAKIERDSQESDLKILEFSELPTNAISDVKASSVFFGLLIGLLVGVGLAFLLEYLDQTIKEPSDVEKLLELPLLGFVPFIETEKAIIEDSKQLAKSIIEPFRAVRANLKHIITQNNLDSLIICSAVKGEGKTTLAANLAITFALDGKRVILVDCDLRRPQIHKLFSTDKENGVADYLQGLSDIDPLIRETRFENLKIITSGAPPANPSELVGTVRFDQMVAELKQRADLVLCDSPALLPVSDVITIAPKFGAVIMVIRTLWTPSKAAKQARNQLRRINCRILGGILNGIAHSRGYYPYYYGYYGYYSYKYSYDYENDTPRKFSMREWGLHAEVRIKEGLSSLRMQLPRYVALSGLYMRDIMRRKRFWLLLLLLLGVTVVEHKSRTYRRSSSPKGLIQFQTPTNGLLPYEDGNHHPAAGAVTIVAADSQMQPPARELQPAVLSVEQQLLERLKVWERGFNDPAAQGLGEIYDSLAFRYTGGDFTKCVKDLKKLVLPDLKSNYIIEILESKSAPSRDSSYYTSSTLIAIAGQPAAPRVRVEMIWNHSDGVWRITGQKQEAR
jgi:tyrosine-protein kinase Etk/Wzc